MTVNDFLISKEERNMYTFRVLVEEMLKRRKEAIRKAARVRGIRVNWHSKKFKAFVREFIKEQGITKWLHNVNDSVWEAPRGRATSVTLRRLNCDNTPTISIRHAGIKENDYMRFVEDGFINRRPEVMTKEVNTRVLTPLEKLSIAISVADKLCGR